MMQALLILKKDIRRFWPEILVSLAITAAFAWMYPVQWLGFRFSAVHGSSDFRTLKTLTTLSQILVALILVSWWLMITRLIQAERLVGENQYWLTRPIRRTSLLGAKLLFLLLFLYLPFTMAQWALLSSAGLTHSSLFAPLFYNLLLITGIIVLPIVGLASITSNFQRGLLALLGAGLLIGLLVFLSSTLESAKVPSSWSDQRAFILVFVGISAMVGVQYITRRIWISRFLLLALVLVLLLDVSNVLDQKVFASLYPVRPATQAQPIVLVQTNGKSPLVSALGDDKLNLAIPLSFSGVRSQKLVEFEALRFNLQAANGDRWSSLWQVTTQQRFLPGTGNTFVNLPMPVDVYKRFKTGPVLLTVELATQEASADAPRVVNINKPDAMVPGFGRCTSDLKPQFVLPFNPVHSLECLTAFRHPYLTRILRRIDVPFEKNSEGFLPESVMVRGWDGSLETDPADLGMTSVWQSEATLNNVDPISTQEAEMLQHARPGGYFFIRYRPTARNRVELRLADFKMPALQSDPNDRFAE